MKGLRSDAIKSGIVIVERFFTVAVGVASSALFARHYGPDSFGALQYGLAAAYLIASITLLANAQGLGPLVAATRISRSARGRLLGTVIALRLFLCTAAVLMIAIYGILTGRDIIFFLIGFVCFAEVGAAFSVFLYDENDQRSVALARTVGALVRLIWVAVCTELFDAAAAIAVLAWLLEIFASSVFMARAAARYDGLAIDQFFFKQRATTEVIDACRQIINKCAPLLPFIVVGSVVTRADRLVMERFMPHNDYGQYVVVSNLMEQWYYIASMIALALGPKMILASPDLRVRWNGMKRMAVVMSFVAVGGSLFLWSFGSTIVVLVYGSLFERAGTMFSLAVVCSVVFFVEQAIFGYLVSIGRSRLLAFRQVFSLLTCLCLVFVFSGDFRYLSFFIGHAISGVLFWMAWFLFSEKKLWRKS